MKIKQLGFVEYLPTWQQMVDFTAARDETTEDELWFLEHPPVFTQGYHGDDSHILMPGDIPVVPTDRGGQVTYHGPGQLVVYFLMDLKRGKTGIKRLVQQIETATINMLAEFNIKAETLCGAPGVYVNGTKICSIGLRVRHGKTYHGLALNVNMDLEPFSRINPCGMQDMQMTQITEHGGPGELAEVAPVLAKCLEAAMQEPVTAL